MTVTQLRKVTKKVAGPSANALTRSIIDYITLQKGFATRINTQGQWDPRIKIMRPGSTVKGMTDIVGVFRGRALFIEVKVGRDELSSYQMDVRQRVERAGGRWFCARDLDSFVTWFQAEVPSKPPPPDRPATVALLM